MPTGKPPGPGVIDRRRSRPHRRRAAGRPPRTAHSDAARLEADRLAAQPDDPAAPLESAHTGTGMAASRFTAAVPDTRRLACPWMASASPRWATTEWTSGTSPLDAGSPASRSTTSTRAALGRCGHRRWRNCRRRHHAGDGRDARRRPPRRPAAAGSRFSRRWSCLRPRSETAGNRRPTDGRLPAPAGLLWDTEASDAAPMPLGDKVPLSGGVQRGRSPVRDRRSFGRSSFESRRQYRRDPAYTRLRRCFDGIHS